MKRKLIVISALVIASILLLSPAVEAKTVVDHDYIISGNAHVAIPVTHEAIKSIDYVEGYDPENGETGRFKDPQDIFVDDHNNIYIADTGNNAVVKLNADGKLLLVITEADGAPIQHPLGVYVNHEQEIFVADNGNRRILHLDKNGEYIENFVAPSSELLSQNLTVFDPNKIGINDYNGYIYMLIGKEFLTLDAYNQFKGLIGTEPVGFNFTEYLKRIFATDIQKSKLIKREPVSYNNFCITSDNKIYAVSSAQSNQIKNITSAGNNIFPGGSYGERSQNDAGVTVAPNLVDIAVNSYGFVTVADQNTSLLYQYNMAGDLLAVFGGEGINKGRFQNISSIAYNTHDQLLVLDSVQNSIQLLKPTAFLEQVHESLSLYLDGRYDQAFENWSKMREMVSCYPVAQASIANILFKRGDYTNARNEYYALGDKSGYGRVFGAIRKQFVSQNFFMVLMLITVAAAGLLWLTLYLRKYCIWVEEDLYSKKISRTREFAGLCHLSVFHPIRAWDLLKWRRPRTNWIPVIVLPLLTVAVRLASTYFTGYTVSVMERQQISPLYEFLLVIVPYITLCLCVYKITSVLSGEINLYETFSAMAYSLLPMIITWPVLTLVSQFVASSEASLFNGAKQIVYLWVIVNILSAVQRINDISLKRTIGLSFLCLLGVVVVWAICLLIYLFSAQLQFFISDLTSEIINRLR